MPANTTRPGLKLRTEEFDRLARKFLGVDTDTEIAARLGLDKSTLSQIRTGKRSVSAAFVATVMTAMPDVPIERLFAPVERDSTDSEASE